MLAEKTVQEFINETKSGNPTPGGGSVSALVGSLGGALTNMVANLTIDKKAFEQVPEDAKVKMKENYVELEKLIKSLTSLIDKDATAFDSVMEAFKLPKKTDEEKSVRSKAIQEGYKKALDVPLGCAEECKRVLKLQKVFAEHGNVNAITDVGVAALLAYSGVEGALFNVTINLKSIKDEEFRLNIQTRVNTILEDSKILKEELLEIVYKRLS